MSLELHQMITLSKVNIRKKGPADARMLMIDIKLSAATDPGILAHFDPTLRHFLFSEHGGPRMRNLKPISWTGEMAHMDLTIAGERFIGAVLTKFKFEPLPSGRLALSLVASVHPEGRQTAILADLAGDEIEIEIRPEPSLDLQLKTADSDVVTEIKALNESLEKSGTSITITGPDGDVIGRLGAESEEAYQEAVKLVRETNRPSISYVQRNLKIGYNAAARILERMEKEGIISALDDKGNRNIISKPSAKKVSGVPIKYRHPDNSDLSWTGRGKIPGWANHLLDQGGQLEVCDAAAS